MKILIGTNNFNKFEKFKSAFELYAPEVELLKISDLEITDEPQEDFDNLMDNAIKKAKFFAEKSGLITISDDTGLFVDVLNGEPGIRAKRWHTGSDHDRCVKLLDLLKNKPREARYKWAFATYDPTNEKLWTFECELEGLMSDEFRDVGGFGYDKMFKIKNTDKHYSELSQKELAELGGRGRAVKELIFNTNFLR